VFTVDFPRYCCGQTSIWGVFDRSIRLSVEIVAGEDSRRMIITLFGHNGKMMAGPGRRNLPAETV